MLKVKIAQYVAYLYPFKDTVGVDSALQQEQIITFYCKALTRNYRTIGTTVVIITQQPV